VLTRPPDNFATKEEEEEEEKEAFQDGAPPPPLHCSLANYLLPLQLLSLLSAAVFNGHQSRRKRKKEKKNEVRRQGGQSV
jgi:hypothetical protein